MAGLSRFGEILETARWKRPAESEFGPLLMSTHPIAPSRDGPIPGIIPGIEYNTRYYTRFYTWVLYSKLNTRYNTPGIIPKIPGIFGYYTSGIIPLGIFGPSLLPPATVIHFHLSSSC